MATTLYYSKQEHKLCFRTLYYCVGFRDILAKHGRYADGVLRDHSVATLFKYGVLWEQFCSPKYHFHNRGHKKRSGGIKVNWSASLPPPQKKNKNKKTKTNPKQSLLSDDLKNSKAIQNPDYCPLSLITNSWLLSTVTSYYGNSLA